MSLSAEAPAGPVVIRLPIHLKWSGPVEYDMSDPAQLRRVYEIVLREGRTEDVRRFIDPVVLEEVLGELVLPEPIRRALQDWVGQPTSLSSRRPA